MNNQRAYQRFPVQLDVKLRKLDGTSADMDAIVSVVSSGGLGINTGEALQPGTEVSVEWPNPPFYFSGKAVAICTVVNITRENEEGGSFRVGLKFSDQDAELVHSLLNWIQMKASAQRRAQSAAKRFPSQRKRIKF